MPRTSIVLPQTLCLHFLLFPTTYCNMQEYGIVTDKNGPIKELQIDSLNICEFKFFSFVLV